MNRLLLLLLLVARLARADICTDVVAVDTCNGAPVGCSNDGFGNLICTSVTANLSAGNCNGNGDCGLDLKENSSDGATAPSAGYGRVRCNTADNCYLQFSSETTPGFPLMRSGAFPADDQVCIGSGLNKSCNYVSIPDCVPGSLGYDATNNLMTCSAPSLGFDFREDFISGNCGQACVGPTQTGIGSTSWSMNEDITGAANHATVQQVAGLTNHPGLMQLITNATVTAGDGVLIVSSQASAGTDPQGTLTGNTAWFAQWEWTPGSTITDYYMVAGLSTDRTVVHTRFPDKFMGIAYMNVSATPQVCKGSGQPFNESVSPKCTGATAGTFSDTVYLCVACNGASGNGPCTATPIPNATPSAAGTYDRLTIQMAGSNLKCSVVLNAPTGASGNCTNASPCTVQVSTNLPSANTRQYIGVASNNTVQKSLTADYYIMNQRGLNR